MSGATFKTLRSVTKLCLSDEPMARNHHGARTYLEWCEAEIERVGRDKWMLEEKKLPGGQMACRIVRNPLAS